MKSHGAVALQPEVDRRDFVPDLEAINRGT